MALDNCFGMKSLGRLNELVGLEAARHNRSKRSIFLDMLRVYLKSRIGPNYYLLAGFSDPGTTFAEKTSHLNNADYHRCLDFLNPREYRKITHNKLTEKAFLKLINAPAAEFVGYWDEGGGFSGAGFAKLEAVSGLENLLGQYSGQVLCFKLLEGWGGRGFLAGKVTDQGGIILVQKLFSEDVLTVGDVLDHFRRLDAKGAFLIETYIHQAESYSQFNETSINTARVWTLEKKDGQIEVIGGNFRIGRQGSLTDNGDGGGIMCPIDINSGRIGPGILTDTPFREEMTTHPDTGAQISGVLLDGWSEIKELSVGVLACLPQTRFCGFDIAMSRLGPVVVEVNVCPDKDGAAYGKCSSRVLMDNAQ